MAEAQYAPPAAGCGAPGQELQALRDAGAGRVDPVRMRYLEVLAQRLQTAAPAVQLVLQGRWRNASAALLQRCQQARLDASTPSPVVPPVSLGADHPLAALNRYIRSAAQTADVATASPMQPGDVAELRSLRVFRDSWSRIAAVDQVEAAVTRGPENAGPLNSHSLVLRSLALMRSVSPDYLRRFLSQVETLMVLEDLAQQRKVPVTKAKIRAARKKT